MLLFLYTLVDPEDHPKIEYIYWTYHDDMVRLAKGKLKNAENPNYEIDAEDVVQNAFIKISTYIKQIDIEVHPKELRAYLLSIASNEATNYIRGQKPCEGIDDYAEILIDTEFIDSLRANDSYEDVVKVIRSMDEKYSTVLLYWLRGGLSATQIAEFMGVPVKTIYTRVERGMKKLHDALEKEGLLPK